MPVEINTKIEENLLNIEVQGAIDSVSSSSFRGWIEEKMLEGFVYINIDLSEIEYLSSDGISVFFSIQRLLESRDGRLSFSGISEELRLLFDFFKVSESIPIYNTAEEAAREAGKPFHPQKVHDVPKKSFESEKEPGKTEKKPAVKKKRMVIGEHLLRRSSFNRGMLDDSVAVGDVFEKDQDSIEKVSEDANHTQPTPVAESTSSQKDDEVHLHQEEKKNVENAHKTDSLQQDSDDSKEKNLPQNESAQPKTEIHQIFCMNCGAKLNVSKPGKYICPACRLKFDYKGR